MKIKRIKKIQKETEVYDLTVPELHNFVLESGIVVHNCAQAVYKSFQQVPLETSADIMLKTQKALDAVKSYEFQQMNAKIVQEQQQRIDTSQFFIPSGFTQLQGLQSSRPNFYGQGMAGAGKPNFYGR